MNTERSKPNRKLLPKLALALSALLLLSLALILAGTSATSLANEARQAAQTVTARAQGSTGEDVPLAGAEGWARAAVEISGAPDDAVVSAVRVKYNVVYPEPSELEVQLFTSGAEASHTLWDKDSAEGAVLTQSTEELTAFQGVPVNGVWSLAARGGDSEGYIDDFSIVVYYETEMPTLQVEGEGPPGTPGFLRLPEGAAPVNVSPDKDEKPAAEESPAAPQDVPPGAIILKTEDFQASFPNPGWEVLDLSNDGYQRYWDDAGCDRCGGDWAAWPADGGANRVNPCAGNNYPNNMYTWMIYGPFDLSDANNAGTEFVMWHDTEVSYDWVFFGFSSDGNNFSGWFFDGYVDCTVWNAYYGSMLGDPSVWVAWVFYSDSSTRDRGAWVDDIVIWKEVICDVTVKIDPPEKTVYLDLPFTADVAIEDAVDLGGFEFDLIYDPTCVAATDATLGPFLGSTGRSVGEVGPTFGTGSVTYGGYSWGASPGPNGDGVLATVTFQAGSSECDSALHLQNITVTDTDGNPQTACPEHGLVRVRPGCDPYCPEDVNLDGVVNIVDIMLVASKWGQSCPTRP